MKDLDAGKCLERLDIAHERRGRRLWAPCPSHKGETANWFVWAEGPFQGVHHCFSCKYKGNLATLASDVLGVGYAVALEWLRQGPDVPARLPPLRVRYETAGSRAGIVLPQGVVVRPLGAWVTPARRYAESRGITPEQVERWSMGYAVEGRLAGRIVLPYLSPEGVLLNYTARSFVDDPKRYLMAMGKERPDRGAVFGEQHWGKERGVVYLFEGALNALAAERASPGVALAVLSGSRASAAQLLKLSVFSKVVVATDPDAAGEQAWVTIRASLARHVEVSRLVYPDDRDAADLPMEELRYLLAS